MSMLLLYPLLLLLLVVVVVVVVVGSQASEGCECFEIERREHRVNVSNGMREVVHFERVDVDVEHTLELVKGAGARIRVTTKDACHSYAVVNHTHAVGWWWPRRWRRWGASRTDCAAVGSVDIQDPVDVVTQGRDWAIARICRVVVCRNA